MATTRTLLLTLLLLSALGLTAQNNSSSLLWQVSGPGIKDTSYLYGTIHLKDKRVFEFNDSLMPKLDQVDVFAMEIDLNPDNMQKLMKLMMLPEGKKLKDFYKKKEYKLIKAHLQEHMGIDIDALERFKPMVLVSMLTTQDVSTTHSSRLTVDEYLKQYADDAGKTIVSIETVEEQMEVFEQVDPHSVIDMIENFDASLASVEQMIEAYRSQDPELLLDVMYKDNPLEEIENAMIHDRNVIMADRFMNMTQEQTVMFAVGAGHLGGTDGVINLLREKGLTVTPIIADHTPVKTDIATVITMGNYRITFPGKPEKSNQPIQGTDQQMTMHIYQETVDDNTLIYLTSMMDLESKLGALELEGENLKLFFTSVMNGMISKLGGDVTDESEVFEWKGFNTYEADLKHEAGIVRVRCLFKDYDFMLLQVSTTDTKLSKELTDDFYDSLELVDSTENE